MQENSNDQKPPVATTDAATPEAKNGTDPNEAWARKEKQFRRMQQQFEQEKRAMQAKAQQYETDYMPKSVLKEQGVRALMEAGWTHEQIMEQMLNATPNTDPTISALEKKIAALEAKLQGNEKQSEEQTTQQYQQAVKQIDREVKLLVDSDPEFESIKAEDMHSAVTELIEQTFQNEGYIMDVKEAAREVENHLVEKAFKLSQLSKVKARQQATSAETTAKSGQQQTQAGQKTLTNNMQASSGRLTDKEKRERAIAAFKGQL